MFNFTLTDSYVLTNTQTTLIKGLFETHSEKKSTVDFF